MFLVLLAALLPASQVLLLLFSSPLAHAASKNFNPVSTAHSVESHHSVHRPIDKSQAYWAWGGSSVATKDFIRLTPTVSSRKGWFWNEYPLESEDFEVEFKIKVESQGNFGGDGFAFWLLEPSMDPLDRLSDPDWLNGDVFGIKNDFKGVGVCFDTYDNDNRRNNPQVFVLENFASSPPQWDHDTDYARSMVNRVPGNTDNIAGFDTAPTKKNHKGGKHKCVAEYRNTGKMTKVLVKYLHQVLHVYFDTLDGKGYRFCLAVTFPESTSFRDSHLAFTSATGQLTDNVDLLEVSTRYLSSSDLDFDDALLPQAGEDSLSNGVGIGEVLTFLGLVACTAVSAISLSSYRQQSSAHIDSIRICKGLNKDLLRDYLLHFAFVLLCLFLRKWTLLLLNLPLAAWRGLSLQAQAAEYTPVQRPSAGPTAKLGLNSVLSTKHRLFLDVSYFGTLLMLTLFGVA